MRLESILKVVPGSILAETVYSGGKTIFHRGRTLTQKDLSRLRSMGIRSIRIEGESKRKTTSAKHTIDDRTREEAVETVFEVLNDFENLNTRKLEKVKKTADNLVMDIVQIDDFRIQMHDLRTYDNYTYRHSVNVAVISTAIANQMHYSKSDLHLIATGALMHDIGKMKIPDSILNKEDKLTHNEMSTVTRHPIDGFDILSSKTQSDPVIWSIARHHHETMDGTGYPDGKKGRSIHPFARIVAVADIWDALRSNRPYKLGWSVERTLEFLNSSRMMKKLDMEARDVLTFLGNLKCEE